MSSPASFNRHKSKILTLIFCGCLLLVTACSPLEKIVSVFRDDGSNYIFKITIDTDPEILDPQLASDPASIAVARNMFVGLLKLEPDGSISSAAAKDYTISQDGLVYTFTIDLRYQWKAAGGFTAGLTARDFVYGFQRLFDPQTRSPYAQDYFCIKNSKKANSGDIEPYNIGVRAIDDETLEIVLEYPNAEFLSLLTKLPASPCNQEFFESCEGKYGLEAEAIASNGPFYVRYWLHDKYGTDNYVRLRRNDGYSAVSVVYPSGVNFLVEKNSSVKITDFTSGTTDLLLTDSPVDQEEDISISKFYTASAGLIINPKNSLLSQSEVLEIISLCVDPNALAADVPDYLKPSAGLIPTDAYVGTTAFRTACDEPATEYNSRLAQYRWSFALTDNEKLSLAGTNVMVSQEFCGYKYVSAVLDLIRDTIGLNLNLEVVNESDYKRRLEEGDYDICFAVITSDEAYAFDYLSFFDGRYSGIYDSSAESTVLNAGKYKTLTSAIRDCSEAEAEIVLSHKFIPIWYVPRFLYSSEKSSDLVYDFFSGAVIFENAKSD